MTSDELQAPACEPLIDDSGSEVGFVAKGKHAAAGMAAAIRRYAVEQRGDGDPLAAFEFDPAWHRLDTAYSRWIPCPPAWDVPYNRRLEMSEMGRGAFVATVVWL
jgi:hypothetical protein